jgi:hypothetical protein
MGTLLGLRDWIARTFITKCHRLSSLNSCILQCGRVGSKIRIPAGLLSPEVSVLGLLFSVSSYDCPSHCVGSNLTLA